MPDVSKATASKSSRSQRTRMQVAQGQVDPSVSTKRTSRKQQAEGITRGQERSNLARSMSDFFPNAVNQAGQAAIGHIAAKQRTKNRAEIERIQTAVRLNPEGAREAVRTNNYSEWLSEESFASQAAVIDTFKSLTAREAALRDYSTEIKGRFAAMDATGDPDAMVSDYLKETLEGADPLFAAEYATIITEKSRGDKANHREAVLNAQVLSAMNKGEAVLRQSIEGGLVPTTTQGLTQLRSEFVAAIPLPAPVAVDKGTDRFESTLLDAASRGNEQAMRMVHMPDPAFDGLSIAQRNPAAAEKAMKSAIERSRQVRSLAAEEDLNGLSNRISVAANGLPGAETAGDLIADVISHRETHGESNRWRTMRDAAFKLVEQKGERDGNFARAANNLSTNYTEAEWSKVASSYYDGTAAAEFAKEQGIPVAQAQAIADKQIGLRGTGKALKDQLSNVLTTSTNVEEVEAVFKRMRTYDGISQRGLSGTHLSPGASDLYSYMDALASAGQDPFAAREAYLASRESAGSANGYLERRRDDEGRAMGKAGVREVSEAAWSEISELYADNNVFFDGQGYDELPPSVRREIDNAANVAGHMMHDQPFSADQVASIAGKLVQSKLSINMAPNGDIVMAVNKTPHTAVGPNGQPLPGALVTKEVLDRGKAAVEANPVMMDAMGEFGGLAQDDMTSLGHGLAVRSMVDGIPATVSYVPGSQFIVDTDELPKGFEAEFFQLKPLAGGRTLVRVPDEGEDIKAVGGVTMRFLPEIGQWSARYIDRGERREAEEVFAPVGSPLPTKDQKAPTTPEEAAGIERANSDVIAEARSRGMISTKPDPNLPVDAQLAQGRKDTKKQGYFGDDMTRDPSQSTINRVRGYVKSTNGRSPLAYDAASGKTVREGGKGDLMIGDGIRLLEPSSQRMIEAVGGDYGKILAGKQGLSNAQIEHLTRLKVDESVSYLRDTFPDIDLAGHQIKALVSYLHSSRWTDKGPVLMTPKLRKAIEAEDLKAAAEEIRNSTRGGHAGQLSILKARRGDEADLFLGHTQ